MLLLLPFVALIFRRGYLAIVLIVLLPMPQESYAFEWSSLWQNKNQQAAKVLEQGDSQSAAEMFADPEWKAAANYRAGDYQKAIESLDGIQKPDALYNRGNALAKAGDLQQAIGAYDEALELNPDHEDAKYNRDLLQKYLEQQQQQQQQDSDQSQNNENNQQNNSSQENSQSAQDQQSDSQQADGSDSDSQQQEQQQSQQQSSQQQEQQSEQNQQADSNQSQQDEAQQDETQQQAQEEQQQDDESQTDDSAAHMAQKNNELDEDPETMQRTEQWLRRIPDDPGGLMRRKFRYQSQIDPRKAQGETKPW